MARWIASLGLLAGLLGSSFVISAAGAAPLGQQTGGSSSTPAPAATAGQAQATPSAAAAATPVVQQANAVSAAIPATGGSLTSQDGGFSVGFPGGLASRGAMTVQVAPVLPESLAPSLFRTGRRAYQVSAADASGRPVVDLPAPIALTYSPTAAELALAAGDLTQIVLSAWDGAEYLGLPCSSSGDASGGTVACTLPRPGVVAVLIVPKPAAGAPLDFALPNGRFFKQANGYGGAGDSGFAVTDDTAAPFWSELQRLGGVGIVGYPVSQRFMYRGFLTQAFQKLALQWRPDQGQAVPVNTLDELNQRGSDTWLDHDRQVPPAADTSADTDLDFGAVVERHVALLDAYPALQDYYLNAPNNLTVYGLPLSVKDYGPFVAVRLQRAVLQLWSVDEPWAAAGQVVVGNGGDLAKDAGLWGPAAVVPQKQP